MYPTGGIQDSRDHEVVPDTVSHGGGAGRDQRRARQHGARRLALAHVRHRQGVRLARRSGMIIE